MFVCLSATPHGAEPISPLRLCGSRSSPSRVCFSCNCGCVCGCVSIVGLLVGVIIIKFVFVVAVSVQLLPPPCDTRLNWIGSYLGTDPQRPFDALSKLLATPLPFLSFPFSLFSPPSSQTTSQLGHTVRATKHYQQSDRKNAFFLARFRPWNVH